MTDDYDELDALIEEAANTPLRLVKTVGRVSKQDASDFDKVRGLLHTIVDSMMDGIDEAGFRPDWESFQVIGLYTEPIDLLDDQDVVIQMQVAERG